MFRASSTSPPQEGIDLGDVRSNTPLKLTAAGFGYADGLRQHRPDKITRGRSLAAIR